ncbi:hypothetical protein P3471_25015, partial [Vibrio parahaemolyticus]|nr:hypothetical protein [Vibrio parahaemolyticus]
MLRNHFDRGDAAKKQTKKNNNKEEEGAEVRSRSKKKKADIRKTIINMEGAEVVAGFLACLFVYMA